MNRVRGLIGADGVTFTGRGVYVAVLDSGVARHPDLNGRIVAFRDFTHTSKRTQEAYFDDNGHGTQV